MLLMSLNYNHLLAEMKISGSWGWSAVEKHPLLFLTPRHSSPFLRIRPVLLPLCSTKHTCSSFLLRRSSVLDFHPIFLTVVPSILAISNLPVVVLRLLSTRTASSCFVSCCYLRKYYIFRIPPLICSLVRSLQAKQQIHFLRDNVCLTGAENAP